MKLGVMMKALSQEGSKLGWNLDLPLTGFGPLENPLDSWFLQKVPNNYYGLNVCILRNSNVEILSPQMMVLGDNIIRKSRLWEVIRSWGRALATGISAFEKEIWESLQTPFTCEKAPSMNNKMGPHQTLNVLIPWYFPVSKTCEK
jgi:hypothetical protein